MPAFDLREVVERQLRFRGRRQYRGDREIGNAERVGDEVFATIEMLLVNCLKKPVASSIRSASGSPMPKAGLM